MRKIFFSFAMVLALLSSACAHKVMAPTRLTLGDFVKDQNLRNLHSDKFSGKISLRFDSKNEKTSGTGRVVALQKDLARVELRDPLGRVQYTLVQAPSLVSIYLPSLKVRYEDRKEGRSYFKRVLGTGFSVPEMRKLWLGLVPVLGEASFTGWEWDSRAGVFRTSKKSKELEVAISVDGTLGAIKEMTLKMKEGICQIDYDDFEEVQGYGFAHRMKLTWMNTEEKLDLEWEDFDWIANGDPKALATIDVETGTKTLVFR